MTDTAYRAAYEGAALYDEGAYGRIRMRGASGADLLHRLSTNDIVHLGLGQGLRTVLTTPIGRIIDLLTVYRLEDALVLITGPGQGGPVYSHLRKNIFFNDKVTLEPMGQSHAQLALYGPGAAPLLEQLAGAPLPDLALHASAELVLAGAPTLVARALPLGGAGFRLLVPAEQAAALRAELAAGGAAALGEAMFDLLRVEHGYAAVGHELGQEYIPLETGLTDAVSFRKGCYVGQEIIARMESRGRMAKRLCGLRLSSADVGGLVTPAKLDVGGKEAGDLTSVVVSPRLGPVALAYVRTAHAEQGAQVGIAGSSLTAEVVELPFEA